MKPIILILMLVLLVGCAGEEALPPQEDLPPAGDSQMVTYGVAGFIESIEVVDGNVLGIIYVKGELGKNGADYDQAYVSITEDTIIYSREQVTFNELKVGDYVNVFFEGPIMESYPVQATAKQVNIVPEEVLNTSNDPEEE